MFKKYVRAALLALLGVLLSAVTACDVSGSGRPEDATRQPAERASFDIEAYNNKAITGWVGGLSASAAPSQTSRLYLQNDDGSFDTVVVTPEWGLKATREDKSGNAIYACVVSTAGQPGVDDVRIVRRNLKSSLDGAPAKGCSHP